MARRETYIDQYARSLAAAQRWGDITRDIESEQDQMRYLQSLITSEHQTLAALQDSFRVEPLSVADAQKLLEQQEKLQKQVKDFSSLSKEEAKAFRNQIEASRGSGPGAEALLQMVKSATPAEAKEMAKIARKSGGVDPGVLTALEAAARLVTGETQKKTLAAAKKTAYKSLEAAYFAGPQGIRGGFPGLEEVKLRGLTASELADTDKGLAKALEASPASTGEEALKIAMEHVRQTGDPSTIPDEAAKLFWERARDLKAYRNDQRADFEDSILESRRRIRELEDELAESPGAKYIDPARERAKRELIARGYTFTGDWKDEFVSYQKGPWYETIIGAEELRRKVDPDKGLTPTTKGERLATSLLMGWERQGEDWTLTKLDKQLKKAKSLSDAERQQALSFALAYTRLGAEGQNPAQTKLILEQDQQKKAEEERLRKLAEQKRGELERQQSRLDREIRQIERSDTMDERQAVRDILREERRTTREMSRDYRRYRGMGLSEKDAREMAGFGVPTAPEAEPTLDRADRYRKLLDLGVPSDQASKFVGDPRLVVKPPPDWLQKMADEEAAPPKPPLPKMGQIGYEFKDPSDPQSPTYRRTGSGFEVLDDKGEVTATIPATNRFAFSALEFAEAGDLQGIERVKRAKEEARKKKSPPLTDEGAASSAPRVRTYNPATGMVE